MASVPPDPTNREPAHQPLVRVVHQHDSIAVMILPGATLSDLMSVTATLPDSIYVDHHALGPADPAATLYFRLMPQRAATPPRASVGGWTPTLPVPPGLAGYTPYDEAMDTILSACDSGPLRPRLVQGLLGLHPADLMHLAELVRERSAPI